MSKFTVSSLSLLYPSPSPSLTSGSLVDSEYLTTNDRPSATSSRTPSPVRPAMIIPPPPPPMTPSAPSVVNDRVKWMPPKEPIEFAKKPVRPDYLSKRKHVPRPPNAFMLFRSMVINKEIPKIENRQQNVSRIAGEIWNVLDDDIKRAWHDKAEEYQREHRQKHPDYKFAPSRKAQVKPKEEEPEGMSTEDYIRHLREKYTGVMGPAVAPARKRKPKARKAKEDEEFEPTPKRTRTRARRSVAEDLASPQPQPQLQPLRAVPLPPVPPHLAPPLPPWRLLHSTSSHMPGSSSLDLMMADEYARMAGVPYGGPVASSSHNNAEGSSRRKACHDDNNDMTFGHIPMAPPFNSSAGGYSAFTHNLLGLGELAIPHDNGGFYQSFYGGSSSHLVDTPAPTAPTSSEAAESFGVYEFNFPDDLLATIVDTSVPLPAPVESSRVPVDSPVHNLPSTSSSPTAPSAEILVSHPSTPASKKHNTTPSYTPAHTPTATH